MDQDAKQELIDIQNSLERLENSYDETTKEMRPYTDEMALIKAKTLLEIAQAKEGGRPLYTNQKLRDAALVVRLHENTRYQELRTEHIRLQDELNNIRLLMGKLRIRRDAIQGPLGGLFR
jgi:hypothetical protein